MLEVPPTAFIPPPKVNSAVVRLVPHVHRPYEVDDTQLLHTVASEAFNQRRKTIRNSLQRLISVEELTTLGLDPALRAENLSVENFCQITRYLTAKRSQ